MGQLAKLDQEVSSSLEFDAWVEGKQHWQWVLLKAEPRTRSPPADCCGLQGRPGFGLPEAWSSGLLWFFDSRVSQQIQFLPFSPSCLDRIPLPSLIHPGILSASLILGTSQSTPFSFIHLTFSWLLVCGCRGQRPGLCFVTTHGWNITQCLAHRNQNSCFVFFSQALTMCL